MLFSIPASLLLYLVTAAFVPSNLVEAVPRRHVGSGHSYGRKAPPVRAVPKLDSLDSRLKLMGQRLTAHKRNDSSSKSIQQDEHAPLDLA